ncbi:MAG TPA: hypothetical protein DEV93_13610 [Chloroflexi bacterium]|jgi:FkbM family methyltransferase|nr:hypothetical protein [Chloroflexota bacterium]
MALRDLARQAKALPKLRSLTDLTGFARLLSPIAREKVIRVKALGGQTVTLRGGTSDTATFLDVFYYRPHLPAAIKPRLIWDLGANIGLTMAHLAHTFPPAHIVGVELDPANATLARRNTQPWADRCEVICAPVWSERLMVGIQRQRGHESGFRVALDGGEIDTLLLNDLLAETGSPDYVKMDIEGAERHVLVSAVAWASHVRALKVECHGSYTADECAQDLARLGFRATVEARHGHGRPAVFGMR